MTREIQTILSAGIPTLAVVIGILVNGARLNGAAGLNICIDNLRSRLDSLFDDLAKTVVADLRRLEERLR